MKRPIFILNGPPGCGKDMLADAMSELVHVRFKTKLYELTADHYGIELPVFMEWATNQGLKDRKFVSLGNISPRAALIHVSENLIKPQHGKHFFGKELATECMKYPWSAGFICSDGGFDEELVSLYPQFDVHIIRIERVGCSFEGDSRKYLDGAIDTICNNFTREQAIRQLRSIINVYSPY